MAKGGLGMRVQPSASVRLGLLRSRFPGLTKVPSRGLATIRWRALMEVPGERLRPRLVGPDGREGCSWSSALPTCPSAWSSRMQQAWHDY